VMGLVPRVALLGSLELSEPGKTRSLGDIPRPRGPKGVELPRRAVRACHRN
jgi:hypothetical protein